eukprot:CAMPEP_0168338024 /NCGR_PEP_ID=MMETSP0213-20121227/12562_1 /TAXON_ID=151035 /ORGANISM="Euplotes harpa, Strain FSP1.4" /LENGTH=34 /DNA_ID= /DNA_START= /DNA_END= /DNA_ORIENTATION=
MAGIILNSGKYINDLGDYDGCNNVPNLHYGSFKI